MNDIFEDEDGFYYWDNDDYIIGPFDTLYQAQTALAASSKWQEKEPIKKMRDNMGL